VNAPAPYVARHAGLRLLLLVAALVLFIVAALCAWAVFRGVSAETELGLVAAGLACYVAAAL